MLQFCRNCLQAATCAVWLVEPNAACVDHGHLICDVFSSCRGAERGEDGSRSPDEVLAEKERTAKAKVDREAIELAEMKSKLDPNDARNALTYNAAGSLNDGDVIPHHRYDPVRIQPPICRR